jgi:hypothetical protein
MNIRSVIAAASGVFLGLAIVAGLQGHADRPISERAKKNLGDQNIAVLSGATKVEVFRLGGRKPGDKGVHLWGFAATGKEQGKAFAARLAELVLHDKTHDNGKFAIGCFEPGVAFRVWKDTKHVSVLVCFKCHNLQVHDADEEQAPGPILCFSETNMIWNRLLRLAKEGLPDDKEIQAMKELRE